VLLDPGAVLWVDVELPRDDPLWDDDLGRAAWWVGELFAAALGAGDVHRGALHRGRWGELVCFAGLGPGEVTVDGAKVVGISQRRTRAGARFQCAVPRRWEPERLAGLLAVDVDLSEVRVHPAELDADAVLTRLP
jgi:lipoate---protein ligase